jgi:predicted small lipoprotein YifL
MMPRDAEDDPGELRRRGLLALLLGAAILAGCGRKGDLYLPDQPDQPEAPDGGVPDDNRTNDRGDNDDNDASVD